LGTLAARRTPPLAFLRRQIEPDVQLLQPGRLHRSGGAHHQVFGLLVHGEEDDFADVGLVGQQHDDAVDAWRGAAVRRGAVAESVQHAAEALFHVLGRVAGDGEGAEHDVGAVVADGALG